LILDLIDRKITQFRIVIDEGSKILIADPRVISIVGIDYQANGFEPQWILSEDKFDKKFEVNE